MGLSREGEDGEMGVDGRKMDDSLVDIFDLLSPSLSP